MSNVRVFKLSTGEELIGRVVSDDDTTLTMEKPRIIAVHPVKNALQVSLVPYAASNPDCTISIKQSAIAGEVTNPSDEIITGYLEQTSGILLGS